MFILLGYRSSVCLSGLCQSEKIVFFPSTFSSYLPLFIMRCLEQVGSISIVRSVDSVCRYFLCFQLILSIFSQFICLSVRVYLSIHPLPICLSTDLIVCFSVGLTFCPSHLIYLFIPVRFLDWTPLCILLLLYFLHLCLAFFLSPSSKITSRGMAV